MYLGKASSEGHMSVFATPATVTPQGLVLLGKVEIMRKRLNSKSMSDTTADQQDVSNNPYLNASFVEECLYPCANKQNYCKI